MSKTRGQAPPTVGPGTDGSHQTGGFDGRWKEAGDAPAGVLPGCHALAARPKASRDGVEVVAMDCFTGFNRHR